MRLRSRDHGPPKEFRVSLKRCRIAVPADCYSPHSFCPTCTTALIKACVDRNLFKNAAVTYATPKADPSMQGRRGFEGHPGSPCSFQSRRDTSHWEPFPLLPAFYTNAPYHDFVPGERFASSALPRFREPASKLQRVPLQCKAAPPVFDRQQVRAEALLRWPAVAVSRAY